MRFARHGFATARARAPSASGFSSALLPPYARRSKSLEVLIPVLYLKGISTGDFAEALAALLGPDASGLSASTVARLTEVWADEHAHWLKRDLSARHYVYFWADGIHVQARLEDDAQCLLVIIGATPEGKKELVGLIDGVRESAQSWRELLLDLKRRGLAVAPELAIADGALGFWKAIEEVWPRTRSQRCWVHKTANVLNKLPKSQHAKAKRALQEIWMAETRNHADSAFDAFIETYAVKYDKAAACLVKDRATMLAFYDFPAEHWKHLRTTNPIESTFATVRHRTVRSKGCLSNKTALAMVFKLAQRRQAEIDPLAGVAVALPVQRLVLAVLLEHDRRQQVGARPAPGCRMERRRRLGDLLARPAGELLAHRPDHLPAARDNLQRLGNVLADLRQLLRAAAPAGCRRGHHHPLARQVRGERLASRPTAGEPLDLRGVRRGQLGRQLVLRRARLKLVELEFELVEKPRLALRALAVEFAPELLDRQLQEGNLRLGVGHHRRRVRRPRLGLRRLGLGRCEGFRESFDVAPAGHRRQRITAADSALQQSARARAEPRISRPATAARSEPGSSSRSLRAGGRAAPR